MSPSTAKYQNEERIDGRADILFKDFTATPINVNTHGVTVCTTTMLTVVTSPITAGFRIGDAIKVGAGTEARRIKALTATTIELERALTTAPGTGVAITRCGIGAGYTKNGAKVGTKTTWKKRKADQKRSPIDALPDETETIIRTSLQQVTATNAQLALGQPNTAVELTTNGFKIKVGSDDMEVLQPAILILGKNRGGQKATIYAGRVANQGESGVEFGDNESLLALELLVLSDDTRADGAMDYSFEVDDEWNLDYLAA
jgi:hypothetical protein